MAWDEFFSFTAVALFSFPVSRPYNMAADKTQVFAL